jgi:hypothetical protein
MRSTAATAEAAYANLARRLARGEEPGAESVLVILAAAGKTLNDLQAACDRLAADDRKPRRIAASRR